MSSDGEFEQTRGRKKVRKLEKIYSRKWCNRCRGSMRRKKATSKKRCNGCRLEEDEEKSARILHISTS